ncbi:MAG: glucose-6-phosphate isomerase [Trueperaceae bacterium]|nr:glucose-6-phosphate isomerase [Trueperaceae bacterium]
MNGSVPPRPEGALRSHVAPLETTVDVSRMRLDDAYLARMAPALQHAFEAMGELERGTIANPDEGRMVGHYWLRAPELAPTPELTAAIEANLAAVRGFAADVHEGRVAPQRGGRFAHLLVIGIGGSALGPQLLADALGAPGDPLAAHFFDNTDPDGIERVLARLGDDLARTLTLVVSKSGGTPETRNGMRLAQRAYAAAGLDFAAHAVAVTGAGSELDGVAREGGWRARFPMWDWVGGRTSLFSAVGLLPAALLGFDVDALLAGARTMDAATRAPDPVGNPAALLALAWHHAGDGHGRKDMVVLPYKDRLLLFSRYLQQLVMESLGKAHDLAGARVDQGIAVYGNKGSTDQHAYVQQLRDGVPNFFATFIQVLRDQEGPAVEIEPDVTAGDYLLGFLLGTRDALSENGRGSLTITLPDAGARSLGALIALYERAVGLYAQLIGVNAYHQPGVEAGKRAAASVIELQRALLAALREAPARPRSAAELAAAAGAPGRAETARHVLDHLAANGRLVRVATTSGDVRYHLQERP